MRKAKAISFGLVALTSFTAGALFLACGADDKGDPDGGARPGRGGTGGIDLSSLFGDSSAPDGSGGGGNGPDGSLADASPEAGKPDGSTHTCESCGSAESAKSCGAALSACRADVGCKRIYDCIYTYRGCGLTSSDIDCIQGCFDDYCQDDKSVSLYLAYDQCTYCSPNCASLCGSYCSAFPDGGAIATRCTGVTDGGIGDADPKDANAIPDSGSPDASDAQADASADAKDDPPPQVCVPGKQEACACVGGAQGAQACNSTGTGYGPCICPKPDAGSGGSGGTGGEGGSGGSNEEEEED